MSLENANAEKFHEEKERKTLFEKEKSQLEKAIKKRQRGFQKMLEKAQESLKEGLSWEKMHHEGLLLQSHLYLLKKGMTQAAVLDWEDNTERIIPLDPLVEPHEQVAKRFRKSKKLRTSIEHANRLIKKAEAELQKHSEHLQRLLQITTPQDLNLFQRELGLLVKPAAVAAVAAAKKAVPYREFLSLTGGIIWVGKSAKENDRMTFSFAKGSDCWLHVRDFPGSHVIIRCPKNQKPDQETLNDAFQLALHFSKAKDQGRADICLTQCKYLSRFGKGMAGKVTISKHQVVHVISDPSRLNRLKQ